MSKILSLENIIKKVAEHKKNNQKVGLVTGCFDVLHEGHIDLFRFGKKNVDILLIGVESDEYIKKAKGDGRPVNALKSRIEVLSELQSIDYLFPLSDPNDENSNKYYVDLYNEVKPHAIVTSRPADNYWLDKQKRALENGMEFFMNEEMKNNSSTNIINRLISEIL